MHVRFVTKFLNSYVAGINQITEETILGTLQSNAYRRVASKLPKLGTEGPWKVGNDYSQDSTALRYSPIDDDALHFSKINQLFR